MIYNEDLKTSKSENININRCTVICGSDGLTDRGTHMLFHCPGRNQGSLMTMPQAIPKQYQLAIIEGDFQFCFS